MTTSILTLAHLRSLIGRHLHYQGLDYSIIEVLEDDGISLVLEESAHTVIQDNQYGEAHRRVAATMTIALHDALTGDLHPALAELLRSAH